MLDDFNALYKTDNKRMKSKVDAILNVIFLTLTNIQIEGNVNHQHIWSLRFMHDRLDVAVFYTLSKITNKQTNKLKFTFSLAVLLTCPFSLLCVKIL